MSEDDYWRLYASQNGLCAICQQERKLCVDHDHETGNVRGLLCGHCNRGLGAFEDDPETMRLAIDYIHSVGHGNPLVSKADWRDAPNGRGKKGRKLTARKAWKIFHDPRSKSQIARDYRVSHTAVCDIKSRKTWQEMDPDGPCPVEQRRLL